MSGIAAEFGGLGLEPISRTSKDLHAATLGVAATASCPSAFSAS
jgi:hypothetical protein